MRKFNKKTPSQPVGRRNLSVQNISAGIGLGADETPIGEPSTIRLHDAYVSDKHYQTGQPLTSLESFENLLTTAKEKKIDLIFLTGDIINYPSETAVRAVLERLETTGIPFLYTAGNHDWYYEGMEGSADFLRETWVEQRLKPLYRAADPMCSATLFHGVNMVCIDDSTYRITERQLEFYRKQKSKPEPLVLLMHIPLYMPTLSFGSCGHPEWGEATDRNYIIERRERWPTEGCGKATLDFVQEVFSTPNLIGIFTGHYHGSQVIVSGGGVQLYYAGCRTRMFTHHSD